MSHLQPSQFANDSEDKRDRPDPVDADYESFDHKCVAETHPTPTKRCRANLSLQSFQRKNVDEAVKPLEPKADTTFCVVTHAPPTYTIIKYTHLVPSRTPDDDRAKLEWAWDLRVKCDKTYLNAPDNIHPLDVTLHRYFNRTAENKHNGWFWLPCGKGAFDIIADMRKYYVGTRMGLPSQARYPNARRNPFEFYPDSEDNKPFEFKYQLVPFPAMKTSWAVRRLDFPVAEFSPATKFEQYYYPFETVPHMALHVPYHSVIYDTGRKLSGAYTIPHLVETMLEQDFPWLGGNTLIVLQSIKDIYEAWKASKPDWLKKASSDTWQPTSGGPNDSSSLGSGGSSGHGSDAGGSDQNPSAQDGAHSQGGFGQGAGRAHIARRAGLHSSSLAPEDSASCVDIPEDFEDAYEEATQPEEEDSDEEYEDPEWLARLQAWMKEVYEATHERPGSPSSSQATTMVKAAAPAKAVEARATEKAAPSIGHTESSYMRRALSNNAGVATMKHASLKSVSWSYG